MNAQHRSGNHTARRLSRLLLSMMAAGCGLFARDAIAVPTATPMAPYQGLFRSPTRAALDAQGNLYVTDSRAGSVAKLSTNGTVLAVRNGLLKPLGVAADNQGRIFVGEEGNGRVVALDAATLTNTLFSLGIGTNEFQLPNHIAVDTNVNGWIYVTDSRTNLVRCYSNATLTKTFGSKGAGNGQFDFPAGLYMSPARELFVVDQNNDRVQVFNSTGTFQRAFSLRTSADLVTTSLYGRAQGITGDSLGNLYVTDVFQGEIKVFDAAGLHVATFGSLGEWIGQLRTPGSLALGKDARLFVTSMNNNRIEVFSLQGTTISMVTLQIVSAFGAPTPAAGIYSNVPGTILTNLVSLNDTRGTTQFASLGWTMTGNSPASGAANQMVMTHTNNAVLTWQWKTQYNLTVSAAQNGSVIASNGWWDAGSTAIVSATPAAYYQFAQWTGTTSSANNPLPLVMTQPHSLAALFAALLATNGVPQWWLASYGLTNGDWDAAAAGDQDLDRVPTWQEWLADTVPTNALSFLGFSAIQRSGTGALLNWHGGVLATQYIERADALVGTQVQWRAVFTNLPPTALSTNYLDPTATNTPGYYRIMVRP